MDSFTVAPELRGTKGDILAARIEVPILAVMIYGIIEFIRLGWSLDHPRSLLLHLRTGSRWRRCLSRSFYIFFCCIGEAQKELENALSSARISSIFLFAIHHWCSRAVHYI
jgi:hypothetical protein